MAGLAVAAVSMAAVEVASTVAASEEAAFVAEWVAAPPSEAAGWEVV
ncbi:MAG TPA: hypothetical protein VK635_29460 [Bradyrhizobium sp.]|nr:hypothetical protein [Bradyrhizobium sp.]